MNRAIDESIDRPIEEFNATSTISRQINGPSIDQAIDRFIDQSIDRRIFRIGRTRERKYKGERSERARQRFQKRKSKKYIHPEARARRWRLLAPIL